MSASTRHCRAQYKVRFVCLMQNFSIVQQRNDYISI